MPITPGTKIGNYEIQAPLGEGGMGAVYQAHDPTLQRTVAIKVLAKQDAGASTRLLQEARAASALNHPHICTIHEVGEHEGQAFIVMEHVEGKTLSQLIPADGLPPESVIRYGTQIADALAHAHERGIVHRDLKSANVVITPEGRAKVLDFGLAARMPQADAEAVTKTQEAIPHAGMLVGTLAYMAPEVLRGEAATARSDIWALGVLLYEMASGRLPFGGDTAADVASTTLRDPPASLPSQVSAGLRSIVHKCLAKEPGQRYALAAVVQGSLDAIQSDTGVTPPVPVAGPNAAKSLRLVARIAALALLAGGLGYFLLQGRDTSSDRITIGATSGVTFEPGLELDPALSPGGDLLAYAAGPPTRMRLFVRQINGERIIPLAEELPGNHRWPQWSPDGSRIAFQARGGIFVVPSLGGAPRRLVEVPPGFGTVGLAWSPDGQAMAYAVAPRGLGAVDRPAEQSRASSLYVQPVDGGDAALVASLETSGTRGIHSPRWSPDGTWIAYVRANTGFVFGVNAFGNIGPSSVWVVRHDGGEPLQITDSASLNTSPAWTADGRSLLFVSNQGGGRDIYQIALDDSRRPAAPPVRLTTGLDAHTISLSSDGSRLVYSIYTPRANVWSIRIPEDGVVSIAEAEPVTTGNQYIEGVVVSPDGQWIGFDSDRSGNQDIYKVPVAGGQPQQLTTDAGDEFVYSWSPNAESLAFHAYQGAEPAVFLVTADGGALERVTTDASHDREPHLSPDGTRVAFVSDRLGAYAGFIASKDPDTGQWATPAQAAFEGRIPVWSPDGQTLLFGTGNGLSVIPLEGGEARHLVDGEGLRVGASAWHPDGRTVYYKALEADGAFSFWAVSATGGEPRRIVEFDDPLRQTRSGIAWDTDGERLYFTIVEHESDIEIAELVVPN